MITKHFLKTLIVFAVIIIFGLLALFLVSYFGDEDGKKNNSANALKAYEYYEEVAN